MTSRRPGCAHHELACIECSAQLDPTEAAHQALSRLYDEARRAVTREARQGGDVADALRVLHRVGRRQHVPGAADVAGPPAPSTPQGHHRFVPDDVDEPDPQPRRLDAGAGDLDRWAVELWLRSLTNLSTNTVAAYRSDLGRFVAWAWDQDIPGPEAVDHLTVRRFVAEMRDRRTPKTR
jgi:hypothetical protein